MKLLILLTTLFLACTPDEKPMCIPDPYCYSKSIESFCDDQPFFCLEKGIAFYSEFDVVSEKTCPDTTLGSFVKLELTHKTEPINMTLVLTAAKDKMAAAAWIPSSVRYMCDGGWLVYGDKQLLCC